MDKLKIKRQDLITISIILISVMLYVGKLFPISYPTDIYNIKLLRLSEYAYKWFLPSGRLVGMLFLYIFDYLNFSVDTYIAIMKVLSIILSSVCIYLFYDLIVNSLYNCNKKHKYLFLLLSIILFLNHGTYQYFYYPESGIMWLSMLFVVLALKMSVSNKKGKYALIWVFIFIAINCYQAITYFYLPALMVVLYLNKKGYKEIIIEIFKSGLIILSNMFVGYLIVQVARNYFDVVSFRETNIVFDIDLILQNAKMMLFDLNDGAPNSIIFVLNFILANLALVIEISNVEKFYKKPLVMTMFLIISIAFVEVLCTVSLLNFYFGDRIQYAYIASAILNMVLLIATFEMKRKTNLSIIMVVLVLLFIANIFNSYNITKNLFIAINISDDIGNNIKNRIEQYEDASNYEIKIIKYCYDANSPYLDKNIRDTWEPTMRRVWGWSLDSALKYYIGRDLLIIRDDWIYDKYFGNQEWDEYCDEQLLFYGSTLYMCIY